MEITRILSNYPRMRLRRLRRSPQLRQLVRQHHLQLNDLVLPLFIRAGHNIKQPIAAMPGHFQWSIDQLQPEIAAIQALKIPAVLLFGIPAYKDATGSAAWAEDGVIQQAIRAIKSWAPELLVMTDVCCCEYTDHGHCGVIDSVHGTLVDNDATLPLLAKQAVSHAAAGADVVAPSAMMDGMVSAIRQGLDEVGFTHVPILSYAVKYHSAFYGPFRAAAEGAPQFGDRSSYQMDYANAEEALREAALDIAEGADMLMVKPAHTYLDILRLLKNHFPEMPLAAYHVSGEYALLKAAAAQGSIMEQAAVKEVLTAMKRAGADFIITYYAKEVAGWL